MNFEQNDSCDQKMLLLKYFKDILFNFYSREGNVCNDRGKCKCGKCECSPHPRAGCHFTGEFCQTV